MAGNNSIQFLRGTQDKINAHSSEILNSGQPLYNISDESLIIGDGVQPISSMNKLKNIFQLGLSDNYLSLNYLSENSIDIRGYTIFFNTNVVPSRTMQLSIFVSINWVVPTGTLKIRVDDGEDTILYSNGQWVLDRYTIPVDLSREQIIPSALLSGLDTSLILGMRYYGEHEMTPTEVNDIWQGLSVSSGGTIAIGDKIISAPDMSGKMATQEWVEAQGYGGESYVSLTEGQIISGKKTFMQAVGSATIQPSTMYSGDASLKFSGPGGTAEYSAIGVKKTINNVSLTLKIPALNGSDSKQETIATREWVHSGSSNVALLNKANTFSSSIEASYFTSYGNDGEKYLYLDYEEFYLQNDGDGQGALISITPNQISHQSPANGDTYDYYFPEDTGTLALEETIANKLFSWDESEECLTVYL